MCRAKDKEKYIHFCTSTDSFVFNEEALQICTNIDVLHVEQKKKDILLINMKTNKMKQKDRMSCFLNKTASIKNKTGPRGNLVRFGEIKMGIDSKSSTAGLRFRGEVVRAGKQAFQIPTAKPLGAGAPLSEMSLRRIQTETRPEAVSGIMFSLQLALER